MNNKGAHTTGDRDSDEDDGVKMPKLKLKTILESENLAKELPKDFLDKLGMDVVEGYLKDRSSRSEWEKRNAKANKLALQVVEEKSFPWAGCSNVKFPLVTIAALQFLSRVAILTKGRQIAKCDVLGADPEGEQGQRAARIGAHLSFQLLEEDLTWLDDDEKAKFAASIAGCAFKKTFFDPVGGVNLSPYVPAAYFVVDYHTKDLAKTRRATHMIPMNRNDIKERERRGVFLDLDCEREGLQHSDELKEVSDEIAGLEESGDETIAPLMVLEQHMWMDLDGDGYQEPYIVSATAETGQVLRVVARFYDQGDVYRKNDSLVRKLEADALTATSADGRKVYDDKIKEIKDDPKNFILRIEPLQSFTKIPFIPSPDGGFYDLGLGSLLGPMNAAVDSIVNQLIDSGTMQNTAGGFLGRGVKMKAGNTGFSPFEWKPVDSNGDDLRKNIVPLPVAQPSNVLFELLGMLISYSERISGSTDIMSGVSPGQNTPAETSRNTIEQGMKIFSGIYGRMHRAFRRELQCYVELNRLFLEDSHDYFNLTTGEGAIIARDDYVKGRFQVRPMADPATASETQRQQKAMLIAQRADATPGYNLYLVERNLLEAYDIADIDSVYPDPKGPNAIPQGTDPKIDLEHAKMQATADAADKDRELAGAALQIEATKVNAQIQELYGKVEVLRATANGIDTGHQIASIDAQIGAAKLHQDGLLKAQELILKATTEQAKAKAATAKASTTTKGK